MREDWIESTLGEVCEINMGQSPASSTYNTNKDGLPFFQGKAEFTVLHPVVRKWCNSPKKIANIDDILLSVRAPVGSTNIANTRCAIGRGLAAITYKPCYKFIYYYLNSIESHLDNQGTGTTFKAISGGILKGQLINFPPLPEQRTIVAKIEQLFSELDNGIANLKTAQEQLKIYRQSVLKKAFEGNWGKTTVGELFDFIGGGTPSKQEALYWNGTIPWASVKDIKGDYLRKTQDYITEEGVTNSSTNIAVKDEVILITRISPGKTVITNLDVAVNQDLKIVKPKFKTYNVFIYYLFKSIEWDIVKLSSGTTVLGINLTNLKSIEIPKIELEEQHQIVQQIESRLSVCDKLEETIVENLQKAEALRQSILKKAFAGELLTEAEIAACKMEKDWEPAAELLKKIKKVKIKS